MTLCQYYDLYAKQSGHKTWNHLCAELDPTLREELKKQLKRDYKAQKAKQL